MQFEREIEACESGLDTQRHRFGAVQFERRQPARPHAEVHLEQRVDARIAPRPHGVDDPIERKLLVVVGLERGLPDAREQLRE